MIVQKAAEGAPRFVMTLDAHQALAADLSLSFGNERFEPLNPEGPMLLVTRHHDDGWAGEDADPAIDPSTGLPFSLNEVPWPRLLAIAPASVDANEALHPYAGLVASMHVYGLYHDRYGLTPESAMGCVPPEHRAAAARMLSREEERQHRLTVALRADPEMAHLVEPDALFCNYFRLQLFDRLAVYLNMSGPDLLEPIVLQRVPAAIGHDVTITVIPVARGVVTLSPFPFGSEPLEVTCAGRYVSTRPRRGAHPDGRRGAPSDMEVLAELRRAPLETQRFTLSAKEPAG